MDANELQKKYLQSLADGKSSAESIARVAEVLLKEITNAATIRIRKQCIVDVHNKWNKIGKLEPVFEKDGLVDALPKILPSTVPLLFELRAEGKLP